MRKFLADANFQNEKVARLEGEVLFIKNLTQRPTEAVTGKVKYTICNADGCLPAQVKPINVSNISNVSSKTLPVTAPKPQVLVAQVGDSTTDTTQNTTEKHIII